MTTPSLDDFVWHPQPKTWSWLLKRVEDVCRVNPQVQSLRSEMLAHSGTRLVDWLDHLCFDDAEVSEGVLEELGFQPNDDRSEWVHHAGLFPRVVRPAIDGESFPQPGLGVKVESIGAFLSIHDVENRVIPTGDVDGTLRYAVAFPAPSEQNASLSIVQRVGNRSWVEHTPSDDQRGRLVEIRESFRSRPRPLVDAASGFAEAKRSFIHAAEVLGRDWACDLFFAAERDFWMSRNKAARIQRQRQDRLGLGWANHDHHTYRSSREHFASLVELLELQGFECRERFYAGGEAGWGAQVLEQPECGLVVFADVDLSEDEVAGDFAHEGLLPRDEYGTVGLWCKLHGEAIMSAGMHHLECQFDFDQARQQLAVAGVASMAPFTDFPHLKQAFTEAEFWTIDSGHLDGLVQQGVLSSEQAERFADEGAKGSHLEILERNDGYKGFNQSGISHIIARTDPRS